MKEHHYRATIDWTGNQGSGTDHYTHYERSHTIQIEGKPQLAGSSDPAFRGDTTKHNPEDLFLSSLASCHMLWYLHFCSVNQIIVEAYTDTATGTMIEEQDGKGRFIEVTLHPTVTVQSQDMVAQALALHKKANECCFIANSVNFPVHHQPTIVVKNKA
ncbi:OsmC family protein [Myroides fluvii]|uniref:OsmC family protein n=1 Tax=Myroides fluvii TaxID=2572594 RepID=UPI00131C38B3|nr:OsmC family protein [Myroides fluvii]